MRPRAGSIIKHDKFMDVAFLVMRVQGPWYGETIPSWYVTGEWINQGCIETYRMEIKQRIRIPLQKVKEWKTCLNPELKCIRDAMWGPIG